MRAKSMVLILIAMGCGLVASIAISQVMERGAKSGNAALETVQIYVAATDIDVNEQLTATNVRVEDWPKSKIPEGSVLELDKVVDQFARVRFYEGEPILRAKLATEIEGAAIKIPEGFRVCSMKVQMDTAVSGLVKPGDRVDIYGYFKKGCDVPRTGTRQILRNVRVFAVNSETEQEKDQEGRTIVAKTVSVLVEQDQVARLMLATELGTLRLALRRPNELEESMEGETATAESLFGGRSEDADVEHTAQQKESAASSQLTAAAGGFTKFLAGLQRPDPATMTQMIATGPTSQEPAWQMTVLTPEGGMNFSWEREDQLPQQGSLAQPQNATSFPGAGPAAASPLLNGLRALTGGSPAAATQQTDPADGSALAEPAQTEDEEEEEEEEELVEPQEGNQIGSDH